MTETTLFLVDDHKLFLSGVQSELSEQFPIVGTASDVDDAIGQIRELQPGVVLVTVISNVLQTHPDTRFLALSVSDSPEDVIAMIRAGARGYVTKSISPADLANAVRRVADGDAVFSPRLAGFVLDAFGGAISPAADPELDQLTPREQEVLRLIARGLAYKQVARKLSISIKTVETHVSSVLRKLQLSSRHELARWASDRRII